MSVRSDRSISYTDSSAASSSGEHGRVHLLPVEFNKAGEATIQWVLQTRYAPGDELVLLHVLYDSDMSPRQAGRQHARKSHAEHFLLDRYGQVLAAHGVQFSWQVNFVLVENWKAIKGYLAAEIARVAEDVDASSICLGSQQRNAVQKLLSLSHTVASRCRDLTRRQVLVCPATFKQTGMFQDDPEEEPAQRLRSTKGKIVVPSGHKGPFVTKSHGYQDVVVSLG